MIAIAGPNLPLEILQASGRYAGPLPFDPDRDVSRAHTWLESKFMPWAAAVLEAWADGEYDHLGQVMFSRADDTSQRMYYYVCELQERGLLAGPKATIFDVAKIPRVTSADRTIAKARDLARQLGVDEAAVEAAIVSSNVDRAKEHPASGARVCLLTGTSLPDDRLHRAVLATGFEPAGQTVAEEWTDLGPVIEEGTGDPVAAVARQLHERKAGPRSFAAPSEKLSLLVEAASPAAVILWQTEEDEAQSWQLPAQRRLLEKSGLPHLVMTRRDWLARDGAAAEIDKFLSGVAA